MSKDDEFYDESKGYDFGPIALCCGCGVNLLKEKHKEDCPIKDKLIRIIKET